MSSKIKFNKTKIYFLQENEFKVFPVSEWYDFNIKPNQNTHTSTEDAESEVIFLWIFPP